MNVRKIERMPFAPDMSSKGGGLHLQKRVVELESENARLRTLLDEAMEKIHDKEFRDRLKEI